MLEAEDYDAAQGLLALGNIVAYTDEGDWLRFDKVAFNANWDSVSVTYAKGNTTPSNVTVHLDSPSNAPVATLALPSTGGWGSSATVSMPWLPISGERNVFVRFNGGFGVANVDSVRFGAPSGTGANVVPNGEFETNANGWFSWSGGSVGTTTARAISGQRSLVVSGRAADSPVATGLTSQVVAGKNYKVSAWVSVDGAGSSTVKLTAKTRCVGGSDSYKTVGNPATVASGGWVELAGELAIPDCALQEVLLYAEGPAASVNLYVDHVSVRPVAAANLVANGTFESGTSGWFSWNGGTLSQSSARFHGGTKSLLVTNRASNAPAATNLTSVVKAGGTYPVSLWVSIDSTDGTSKQINVTRKIACAGQSDSYAWVGNQVTVADDGQWVKISGTLTIPQCTLTDVQLYAEGGAGADLYIDDVQVIDASLQQRAQRRDVRSQGSAAGPAGTTPTCS